MARWNSRSVLSCEKIENIIKVTGQPTQPTCHSTYGAPRRYCPLLRSLRVKNRCEVRAAPCVEPWCHIGAKAERQFRCRHPLALRDFHHMICNGLVAHPQPLQMQRFGLDPARDEATAGQLLGLVRPADSTVRIPRFVAHLTSPALGAVRELIAARAGLRRSRGRCQLHSRCARADGQRATWSPTRKTDRRLVRQAGCCWPPSAQSG